MVKQKLILLTLNIILAPGFVGFKFTNMSEIEKNKEMEVSDEIAPKQQQFVNGVASGDSATTAYINVYDCKKESASSAASRLLKKPSIKEELSRLKKAAKKKTLMDIDQKRALLTEIILSPAIGIDPDSPLAQNVTIRRKTLPDGIVEENVIARTPDKLRAMELDAKLGGQFEMRDKLCYEDTYEGAVRKMNIIYQNDLPVSLAVEHMNSLKNIYELWEECGFDPFDGKKDQFLKLLGKVREFAAKCRFMQEEADIEELDKEGKLAAWAVD